MHAADAGCPGASCAGGNRECAGGQFQGFLKDPADTCSQAAAEILAGKCARDRAGPHRSVAQLQQGPVALQAHWRRMAANAARWLASPFPGLLVRRPIAQAAAGLARRGSARTVSGEVGGLRPSGTERRDSS